MKKIFLFFMAVMLCISANAKEYKVSTGGMRCIIFEVPDDYECIYECDSVKNDIRYKFRKADGTLLTAIMVEIDNMDKKKAEQLPDTVLIPGLKGLEILESDVPKDGEISRIITSKDRDGSILRDYLCISSNGIFIISAYSPTGDFSETGQIVQTIDTRFQWGLLACIIVGIILVLIPSYYFGNAWEHRKYNKARLWKCIFWTVCFALVLSIVGSLLIDFSFCQLFLAYLACVLFLGYAMGSGMTIISF